MTNQNISVTSMEHRLLSSLGSAPFDDLFSEDFKGDTQYYSFDAFRRLYNDAVESMNCYRSLVSTLEEERDAYISRCSELEDALRELSEDLSLVILYNPKEGDATHF